METHASTHPSQPETIQRMFGAVARRYDLANTILSCGVHHWWRRVLVRESGVREGSSVLDAATGTGDLALLFAKRVGSAGKVVGADFAEPMLEQARLKQGQQYPQLSFQCADVMKLPFSEASFDVVSISFGIRNVRDPVGGIRELTRVLKPGGRLLVLEFGGDIRGLWGRLFKFYSDRVLPWIGGIVTGAPAAYRYLQRSSAVFPCRDEFVQKIKESGREFRSVTFRPLTGGIAYLYSAQLAE